MVLRCSGSRKPEVIYGYYSNVLRSRKIILDTREVSTMANFFMTSSLTWGHNWGHRRSWPTYSLWCDNSRTVAPIDSKFSIQMLLGHLQNWLVFGGGQIKNKKNGPLSKFWTLKNFYIFFKFFNLDSQNFTQMLPMTLWWNVGDQNFEFLTHSNFRGGGTDVKNFALLQTCPRFFILSSSNIGKMCIMNLQKNVGHQNFKFSTQSNFRVGQMQKKFKILHFCKLVLFFQNYSTLFPYFLVLPFL